MGVRLVRHEATGLVPTPPAAVALAVVVSAVGLRLAALVPFTKKAVPHPRVVNDLAREPAAAVPEAPGARSIALAVVMAEDARLAAVVPGRERGQLVLPHRAPERWIGRREADDERGRGLHDVDGRLVGAARGKVDLLRDERAVVPTVSAP